MNTLIAISCLLAVAAAKPQLYAPLATTYTAAIPAATSYQEVNQVHNNPIATTYTTAAAVAVPAAVHQTYAVPAAIHSAYAVPALEAYAIHARKRRDLAAVLPYTTSAAYPLASSAVIAPSLYSGYGYTSPAAYSPSVYGYGYGYRPSAYSVHPY